MAPVIGCVIATFGDESWRDRGHQLVFRMMRDGHGFESVVHCHSGTLAQARNAGAELCITEGCDWLVFLDADDHLDDGYAAAMSASIEQHPTAVIHRPATIGFDEVTGELDDAPVMIPKRNLQVANYIVIGAGVQADAFKAAGGFKEYEALEDWALWRAIVANGGEVADAPDAIYIVTVRARSRNQDQHKHRRAYAQIQKEVPL